MWMFIGDNTEFYLDKWRTTKNPKVYAGWNWPAFFATYFWFGYRKMYKTLEILLIIISIIGNLIYYSNPYLNTFSIHIFETVIWFLLGIFGNSFYYNHSRKTLTNIKKFPKDDLTFQGILLKKGGNSWGGVGIALLLIICISVVIDSLFKYVILLNLFINSSAVRKTSLYPKLLHSCIT